jgi:hypothetical protein
VTYRIGAVNLSIRTVKTEYHEVTVTRDQYGGMFGIPRETITPVTRTNIFLDIWFLHCFGSLTGFKC